MAEQLQKKRILWLDVLKFIGIWEIYIGHYSQVAGALYFFTFTHHVALFFFAAGCAERYNTDSLFATVKKRAVSILMPFYLFALASVVVLLLLPFTQEVSLPELLIGIGKGAVRNQFFAVSLWFLTAMFVSSVLFQLIKLVKYKPLMLILSLAIFYAAKTFIPVIPSWPYNVDSAFVFLFYQVVGYCAVDWLEKLFSCEKLIGKIIHYVLFAFSGVYTVCLYFNKDIFALLFSASYLQCLASIPKALVVILFFVFMAWELRHVKLFASLGKETLYACGNEYIIKSTVPAVLQLFGLTFVPTSPFTVIVASFLLLIAVSKLLVPWQKKLFAKINFILLRG